MSAYEALAFSYDGLTQDIAYEETLNFVESVLQRLGKTPKTVLDLACGTGSLSVMLARKGYAVLGVDLSEDMLTVAYDKALELEGERPLFICQPMQELELPQPVELAVCCLDSLNYVTDPADVRETFRRVYGHLTPGGVFLFDINSAHKLRGLDGQVFLDENDDSYCVWRAEFEEAENICYYGIDLFQRDGDVWRRSFEEHAEYAYTTEELTQWLLEAGFDLVLPMGDRRLTPPRPEEQRIYFAAVKEEP